MDTTAETQTITPQAPASMPVKIEQDLSPSVPSSPSQNFADFKPTANQKLWLSTSIELRTKSASKIERKCNISRRTFYLWIADNKGFIEWYNTQFDLWLDELKVEMIEAGAKHAAAGNHSWWRDMMILLGIMRPEQFEQQEAKPVSQVNVMAAAFTKSAQERGKVIDVDSTGSISGDSPQGS